MRRGFVLKRPNSSNRQSYPAYISIWVRVKVMVPLGNLMWFPRTRVFRTKTFQYPLMKEYDFPWIVV